MEVLKNACLSFFMKVLGVLIKIWFFCYLSGAWLLCVVLFCMGWMENMQSGTPISVFFTSFFEYEILPIQILKIFWNKIPHIDLLAFVAEVNGLDGVGELLEGFSILGGKPLTLQEQVGSFWKVGLFKLTLMSFFYFLFSRINQFIIPRIDLEKGSPKELIKKKIINSTVYFCISIPHVTASLFASISVTEWLQSVIPDEKIIVCFLLISVIVLLLHTLLLVGPIKASPILGVGNFLIDIVFSFCNGIMIWFLFGIILFGGNTLLFPLVYMAIAFVLLLEDDFKKIILYLISSVFKLRA